MRKIFLITFLSICSSIFAQDVGTVKGLLLDKEMDNSPLPFANISIKGTEIGASSEMDGTFNFEVPSGSYIIEFSFVGYKTIERKITALAGKTITVNETMKANDGNVLKTVFIQASSVKEKKSALLLDQKKATIIKESIGSIELAEKGVSNAAGATTKIAGVSKNENSGDVYIRGLGDRYLSTTMNGLPIPSDNVNNKNINLNLFGTSIIQNVGISKTFTTSSYADQGSGAVDIATKSYSKNGIKIGFSGGTNTSVMNLKEFKQTAISNDVKYGFYETKYSLKENITKQGWDAETKNNPFNYGISLRANQKFNIFGKKLTLVSSASSSSSNNYQEGLFRSYGSNVLKRGFSSTDEYDTEKYTTNTNLTGYLRLGLKLNSKNKLKYNTLLVNKSKEVLYEQGRKGLGFIYDQEPSEEGAFTRDQNFKQTTLIINQFLGDHRLNDNNTLKWGAGYNVVLAKEPNRIRNQVLILDPQNIGEIQYINQGTFIQRKSSQQINDDDINLYINNKWVLGNEDKEGNKQYALNYGINFRRKTRDFNSQFIGVVTKYGVKAKSIDDISETFTEENLNNGIYDINVGIYDIYKSDLLTYAGFVNFDFKFKNNLSGNLGLRFEKNEMNSEWDISSYTDPTTTLSRDYQDLYPSVNLKYEINNKNYIRFASSATQTLPEFKELTPFNYVSPTGRVIGGNQLLEKSEVYNTDLKWEFFPSKEEIFSASLFYKRIDNPINLAITRGSSGNYYYANTGKRANVLGAELEGKISLLKNKDEKSILSTTANVTYMYLNQDLHKEFQFKDVTETTLQGASDFIFNGSINYNSQTEKPMIATITANYSSDKIIMLGGPRSQAQRKTFFNDHIIQKGFVTLNAVASKKITKNLTAKLIGKNLFNPEIKQTQKITNLTTQIETNETIQSYKNGTQLSIGLSLSF